MIEGGAMRLVEKVKRLEKNIYSNDEPLRLAIRYLDGKILWNDQVWENEKAFSKALDVTFKDQPQKGVPRVIIVSYYRELSENQPIRH
jgi:hypothetical protein